ncbi:DUF2167 domain-containing protein [Paenibacillus sp. FSL R7-0272]|uniref:DUF2167 domain-containing protein n=1 Tax=Paenibacillus sp. FSL R7-0272 TaxID=2921679 RepID=UPI0030D988FB
MKKLCIPFVFTLLLLTSLPFSTMKVAAENFGSADGFEWQSGPTTVSLEDIASLNVPENLAFFDKENTKRFMKENPPPPNGTEIGSLYNMNMQLYWNVIFEYHDIGNVNDHDKNELDADELLESYKQSPEGQHEKASSENQSSVLRWDVEPVYEESKHQLRYSIGLRDPLQGGVVYYKVNLLTREGYISVILVTPSYYFEESRKQFEEMVLQNIKIKNGHTYQEYNASLDKKSELGLIHLIPGGDGIAATKKEERQTLIKKGMIFIVTACVAAFIFIKLRRKPRTQK